MSLKLNVDFDKNVLHGAAKLEFEVLKTVNEIVSNFTNLLNYPRHVFFSYLTTTLNTKWDLNTLARPLVQY